MGSNEKSTVGDFGVYDGGNQHGFCPVHPA